MKNQIARFFNCNIPGFGKNIQPACCFLKLVIVSVLFVQFISCEEMLLGPETENSPQNNLKILWKTLDENYVLFPVKKINWDSLYNIYSSKISSATTESELWNISAGLIQELNDGHVTLFNKGWTKSVQSSEINKRIADDFSLKLIKDKFLEYVKTAGGGYFTYGKVKNANIGYIHLISFASSNYGNGSDWAYDIDKILQELKDTDALIIDLRNNGGGLKITGRIIASAFVDREITYFYQQEKTGPGHNDFGEPIPLTVSPRNEVLSYTKRVALLTNRFSGSGSEHFAQVCEFLPNVIQIGDTTFGCFGDVINIAQLPNGWTFRYPCRLTKTPDGYCPEGVGIIPDILVENHKADISSGRDNVMIKAVDFLSQ